MADTSENQNEQQNDQQNDRNATEDPPRTVMSFLLENKYDSCLWLVRLYIIFSAICYIIPVLGVQFSQACFKRVLLGSAAISAMRLQQRVPRIQFSMEFARQLVLEDSFHYFIYSVLFLVAKPATVVLIPILIFAVMHAATCIRKIIDVSGSSNSIVLKIRQLICRIGEPVTQQNMLLFIASTEIVVFFFSVVMAFSGQATILVPFFYYRFLQLRYASRRNPYSRMAFGQFRSSMEDLANNPRCPGIGRRILHAIISIALRLKPATTHDA